MTWTLTCSGLSVVLPLGTRQYVEGGDCNIDSFEQNSSKPILSVTGLSERSLPLQGSIYVVNQTNAYLETNYLVKLRAMRGKEVTLASPDSQFDGNWILKSFSFSRAAEGAGWVRYQFAVLLVQGSSHYIL